MPTDDELSSILQEFEICTTPFEAIELSGRLGGLAGRLRDGGDAPSESLLAEVFAWSVLPDYTCKDSGWGTYYGPMMGCGGGRTVPNISDVNTGAFDYWVRRSQESKNPSLKARYADVAWDFAEKLGYRQVRGRVAPILLESILRLADNDAFPDKIEGYRSLKRALGIAVLLREPTRLNEVRDRLIAYEDRYAVDCLPGTWGMSFDWLLRDNRKMKLTQEQEAKIIVDLESRLTRLSDRENVAQLDPHHIEGAALRLATYYRRVSRREDLRRVMGVYTRGFMRKAETNPWTGSAWLQDVHRKLIEFQLHDDAKKFQPTLRDASLRMREQMPRHMFSVPIDTAEFNAFIDSMLQGGWDEIFHNLIGRFLPCPARELEQLRLRV